MDPHDEKPRTRTAATKPAAAAPLSTDEQRRLEKTGDAEHADGPRRERLTKEAASGADQPEHGSAGHPKPARANDGDLISADDRHPRPA